MYINQPNTWLALIKGQTHLCGNHNYNTKTQCRKKTGSLWIVTSNTYDLTYAEHGVSVCVCRLTVMECVQFLLQVSPGGLGPRSNGHCLTIIVVG